MLGTSYNADIAALYQFNGKPKRFLIDFFDLNDMFRFVTSEEEGKLPKKNSTHTLKQTLNEY